MYTSAGNVSCWALWTPSWEVGDGIRELSHQKTLLLDAADFILFKKLQTFGVEFPEFKKKKIGSDSIENFFIALVARGTFTVPYSVIYA